MRIYLDGMFFRSTGVGRVYENLLRLLLADEGIESVATAVPRSEKQGFMARYGASRVEPLFLPYGPMSVGDLTTKSLALRRNLSEISLYYYPGHNVPMLAPTPYVVTVNDTTVFSPLVHLAALKKAAFRWRLGRAIRNSSRVVTISKTARADLVRLFPRAEGKTEIIYPWVDDAFFDVARGVLPTSGGEHAIEGDYLLFLGLRIHHKNLDGLLAAFEILAPEFPGLRLVVAGRRSRNPDMVDAWKTRSPFAPRVLEVIGPSDDAVLHLLAGAKALIFPSLAEGFGLPPLEAMAAGVPVVCSDLPVLREILADNVTYIDPARPDSIAEGCRNALSDAPGRPAMIAAARDRARLHSSRQATQFFFALLDQMTGRLP